MPDDARDRSCMAEMAGSLRELLRLLLPLVGTQLLSVGADRWTLTFVGHYDYKNRAHFDGAGIGKMYSNITGLSLGVSATIGLATFCAQAYGAGRTEELSPVYIRRAILLLSMCFIFSFCAAVFCEPLLDALGQPPEVAKMSARYAQVQLIGVPFWWISSAGTLALSAAKHTTPGLIMNMVSAPMQIFLCYVFLNPALLNIGFLGNALARALGGIIGCIVLCITIKVRGLEHLVWRRQPGCEKVLKAGAFKSYLAVSIPSAVVVWSEWWAFEVLSLLVGRTPDAEINLAAHGTMFNIITVFYMCWTAACMSLCTLVGNYLGARQNERIPPLLRTAFVFSLVTSLAVALGYELLKSQFAMLFTEDEAVRHALETSSLGLVLSVPCYAQLMTFFGALRGANLQRPGILGNFVGYWVVGLPVGALCGVVWHWPSPLLGVWMGNVIALFIAACWVLISVFLCIDWHAIQRVDTIGARLLEPSEDRSTELRAEAARKVTAGR